jgi:hypothetical protein
VKFPPRGELLPGPNYLGLPGRNAIIQGQVFLVAIIFIAQLWLVTTALYDLLALFSFISLGIMAALAVITHSPFIFPSLGPTAFLFFYRPTAPAASLGINRLAGVAYPVWNPRSETDTTEKASVKKRE